MIFLYIARHARPEVEIIIIPIVQYCDMFYISRCVRPEVQIIIMLGTRKGLFVFRIIQEYPSFIHPILQL